MPRWRGYGVDFLLGCLVPCALPPIGLWPLLLFIIPSIFWRCAASVDWRCAFVRGWLFGCGQFFVGLYWVGAAFLVEADMFLWALPFAVCLLAMGLGLFCALAFAVWRRLVGSKTTDFSALLYWVVCLSASEWLRGHILTGFPWNLSGMAFLGYLPLAQAASLWGIYGQSFLVLLLALSPVFYLWARPSGFVFLCLFAALLGGGLLQLADPPMQFFDSSKKSAPLIKSGTPMQTAHPLHIRIVQPSIVQKEKWRPENRAAIIDTYLALTQADWQGPTDWQDMTSGQDMTDRFSTPIQAMIIVWPETALPALIDNDTHLRQRIADILPKGSVLITGALRRVVTHQADGVGFKSFNSIMVLNDAGEILQIYDKYHLVPFGEYLPFQRLLERIGLTQLTRLRGGFVAGRPPQIQYVGDIPPFMPLICYEVIFPNLVAGRGRQNASLNGQKRPAWLVNVTNDGWFGRTIGPGQHLAAAQMRAIELGLPLVRAANTGISALIDGRGRIVDFRPLYVRNVLDVTLPPPLAPTFYSRFGDGVFFLMLLISVVLGFLMRHIVFSSKI
ncbi:MAG: apolipoprotein N-acyltransferase [Alphaproteobacteria bacterium]|nr:apolipoprotein N-acyltransferase [Alphaproteobacteria bacterium]